MNKKEFGLTICLPIWYGAKLSEVEFCLDSMYVAMENFVKKNKDYKVSCLIGIDNLPQRLSKNNNLQDNIKEILKRINIFKQAVNELNKEQFNIDYFITEFNVRVSVMRNIMISKTQNSNFITFIDHDDALLEDSISTIFEAVNKNKNKNALYFLSKNAEYNLLKFEFLCPWSVLYNPNFLLRHNISFIPGIPFEDRFFRRELELYLINEEQTNINKAFYIHNKERGGGFLDNDMLTITRQEVNKRIYYLKVKPKIYSITERGFDRVFYVDILSTINKIPTKDDEIEKFIKIEFNNDNFFSKQDLNNRILFDERKINKYEIDNSFELCKILFNGNREEVFCRGYLTNGEINCINKDLLQKINKLIKILDLNAIKLIPLLKYLRDIDLNKIDENILNTLIKRREENIKLSLNENNTSDLKKILDTDDEINLNIFKEISLSKEIQAIVDEYIFNQAFIAIQKEDIEKLTHIIKSFPNVLKLQRKDGINLQNIASRRQIPKDTVKSQKLISKLKDDRDKIITQLLLEPKYFLIKDQYNKSGADFLLFEYTNFLKTNCNLDDSFVPKFLDSLKKLLIKLKDQSYKVVDFLRFLYGDFVSNNKLFGELLNKNNDEIFKELESIKNKYIFEKLIPENILLNLKNSNYENLKNILVEQSESVNSRIGIKENFNTKDVAIFCPYTHIIKILEYKISDNKTILSCIENDKIFKDILEKSLANSFTICNKKLKEPLNIINIEIGLKILEVLKNTKNNFNLNLIKYNDVLDIFLNNSKILMTAQIIAKKSKKIENLLSNNKAKNTNNNQINLDLITELFDGIDTISKNENDIEKLYKLFELFKNYLKKIKN